MAKKNKSETTVTVKTKHSVTNLCAFWGLAIAAVLFIVSMIIALIDRFATIPNSVARVMDIFQIVSEIALLVAVALPAHAYVRGKKRSWRIFFWVAFAIYVLGVVFGVIAINW